MDVLGWSRQGFDPDHSLENLGGLSVLSGSGYDSRAIDQVDLPGKRDILPDLGNKIGINTVSP